ncbi:unnamed protein product [Brachionus calyciflorus]|uniref:Uncharacterized protein n=1 Tax=Brachionus calyciflorus TaxID=104777 RepID=A0A814DMH6_9BILA|nr:unnamed protein product [Brachionus calyciflorus]
MIDFEISNLLNFGKQNSPEEVELDVEQYSEEDEENDQLIQNGLSLKRKRYRIIWTFQRQSHDLANGSKLYYRCKYSKCPAGLYLFYFNNKSKISLFTNHFEHDHSAPQKNRGIPENTKEIIRDLYDLGVKSPLNIIYALRDKKLDKIPTQRQI